MTNWNYVFSGGILLGYWVIGLVFFRFRRRTRDRLFGFFACAFWLLAVERLLLILIGPDVESRWYIYIIRLIAFLFILYAIYDKNILRKTQEQEPK